MKGLILLTNGFEDVEAIATIDVLRRSNIQIDTVALDNREVITQSNNKIIAQYLINDIAYDDYHFLIIPGGKAVFEVLDKDLRIDEIIEYFYKANKLICAICAAPLLLAKKGYFQNRKFTSFPNCVEYNLENCIDKGVVVSDKIITAKSMYYSIEFALEIIAKVQGETQKQLVLKKLKGE